jgi:hypothetical protein
MLVCPVKICPNNVTDSGMARGKDEGRLKGEIEKGIVLSCSADSFLAASSCSPDMAGYSGLHILDVLSIVVILHYLSHSDNPDLALKSQMSCPGSIGGHRWSKKHRLDRYR